MVVGRHTYWRDFSKDMRIKYIRVVRRKWKGFDAATKAAKSHSGKTVISKGIKIPIIRVRSSIHVRIAKRSSCVKITQKIISSSA